MKKILLIGVLVISGLSFGRDYEVRERQELKIINEPVQMDQQMLSREREIFESNIINYSEFHKELDNMDRGHDNR